MLKSRFKAGSSTLFLVLLVFLLAATGCKRQGSTYEESDWESQLPYGRDPLPGELVMNTLKEDSMRVANRVAIKQNMLAVLSQYRKNYNQEYFNGYFVTDIDKDGLPELWVKIGSYRENAKLELFYPNPDGTLRKSDTPAEPGQYYLGDDYLVQVVGAGPGYININRISIHNGTMDVENVKELDLYSDPEAQIPKFKERELRHTSLANLGPLNSAFQ